MSRDLVSWLPKQRWFGDKGRTISRVTTLDAAEFGAGGAVEIIEVEFAGGPPGVYQLAALETEAARRQWLELMARQGRVAGGRGVFELASFAPLGTAATSRLLGAEQSNTSLIYCDADRKPWAILKLFRRLQPGVNPECEILRGLAGCGFRHVPAAWGEARHGDFTLASLQQFVPNQGDGWTCVVSRLKEGNTLDAELTELGARTAQLHQALASVPQLAFAPEPATGEDAEQWRERALQGVAAPGLEDCGEVLEHWRERLASGTAGAEGALGSTRIRIHGDYHLGQVLRSLTGDWAIFDFEGEPTRSMMARRKKGSALQDVAGMLRSFSYAAAAAVRPEWEAGARRAFLDAYFGAAGDVSWLPGTEVARAALLHFFETEKAVYELAYELAHRPDWVKIPWVSLRRLAEPG